MLFKVFWGMVTYSLCYIWKQPCKVFCNLCALLIDHKALVKSFKTFCEGVHFSVNIQLVTYFKKLTLSQVFSRVLLKYWEHLFYKTPTYFLSICFYHVKVLDFNKSYCCFQLSSIFDFINENSLLYSYCHPAAFSALPGTEKLSKPPQAGKKPW